MKRYEMKKIAAQYQDIKAQIKALEDQKAAMEAELKAEMDKRQIEEIELGSNIIRYQTITSNRFDSKRFREENANMYAMYTAPSQSRRFTVAAIADPTR